MAAEKIKLLIIPELFPTEEQPYKGIFLLDYIACVLPYCEVSVLQMKGNPKAERLKHTSHSNYQLYEWSIPVDRKKKWAKGNARVKLMVRPQKLASSRATTQRWSRSCRARPATAKTLSGGISKRQRSVSTIMPKWRFRCTGSH